MTKTSPVFPDGVPEDPNRSNDPELLALIKAFPRLFRGEQPRVWSHVPPGWAGIMRKLCGDIDALLSDAQARSFQVQQMKEKFATLRFYWSADFRASPKHEATVAELDRLVDLARADSAVTCYECGEPGKLRSMGGWLSVRCDAHSGGHAEVQQ